MTDEEINDVIAVAGGWTWGTDVQVAGRCWHDPNNKWMKRPSYTTDHNAMHEAKLTLNEEQREKYLGFFCQQQIEEAFSSARLQAEAFVRAIGKWRRK